MQYPVNVLERNLLSIARMRLRRDLLEGVHTTINLSASEAWLR
jgi:hypothetical protein